MTEFDRTLGRLGSRIAASRGWALALALGITALACLALPSLRVDNSNEGTFGADDPVVVDYRAFKATFGNDEVVIVALEVPGKDALDPEFLVALGDLENELGALAHVRRTTSLRSVEVVEADETTINVHPFLDRLPPPAGARDVALSHPRIAGCLLSADGAVTAIVLDIDVADEDNVGKLTLVREAREILARRASPPSPRALWAHRSSRRTSTSARVERARCSSCSRGSSPSRSCSRRSAGCEPR